MNSTEAWSKADLLSLFFVVLGIISLIFSASDTLSIFSLMLASLILLHEIYKSRYKSIKYRDFLCHYQAVLTSANDGWIAWNINNEYIGSSRKFREELGLKLAPSIPISEIIASIDEKGANELAFQISKLKKTGAPFSIIVSPCKFQNKKIKICGQKMIVSGIETTSLWISDITNISNLVSSLEEKLFESEESLAKKNEILDALPMQIWTRNSDLKISYCNKKYSESVNVSQEAVIENNIPLISGNLFGQGHSLAENAKKCNRDQIISQFTVINGFRKKLELHENRAMNDSLIGFARDITEEDRLSVDLDRIITANYNVLDNFSTAIAIFGENKRLIFFNSAYQKLMKLEAVWLHAKPTYSEVLDELRNNRQTAEHIDFQAFKKKELNMFSSVKTSIQEPVYLPNGKTLNRLVAPYPLGGLVFIYEDISDSLALQRQNNTLLAVHKETIGHLHEGILVYGSNNRIKILNKSLLKIWNIPEEKMNNIIGIHVSEVLEYIKEKIDYENKNSWQEFKENAISSLTDRIPKTGRLVRIDDSVVLFSYIPLPDGAHMLSFNDITDSYVVEKAIMEKNLALKEAHKQRYEFIAGISTELKEPINSLIGFTELLSHEYYGSLNDKQKEYCKYILDSSNQLYQLINSLLEMVLVKEESSELDLSIFVVKDAINDVVSIVEKRARNKDIAIDTYFENPALNMNGDKHCIKQVLFNLLINAIQASPEKGKIEIRTVVDNDTNFKIIIKNEQSEGTKLSKNNNAYKVGIERNSDSPMKVHIRKILESKSASMSLVKSLIEQQGGTLSISSDSKGNNYVICSLPTHCDNKISSDKYLYEYKDIEGEKKKAEIRELKTAVNE